MQWLKLKDAQDGDAAADLTTVRPRVNAAKAMDERRPGIEDLMRG